jgi:hypothetical protein
MSSTRIPDTVLLVVDQTTRRFTRSDLSELTHTSSLRDLDMGATTDLADSTDLTSKALATDTSGTHLVAEYVHKVGSKATARFAVWHADAIESDSSSTSTAPILALESKDIKRFLGMFGHHVVFLDHALRVCSVDLEAGEGVVKKHFFVPLEFVGGNEGGMGCVS